LSLYPFFFVIFIIVFFAATPDHCRTLELTVSEVTDDELVQIVPEDVDLTYLDRSSRSASSPGPLRAKGGEKRRLPMKDEHRATGERESERERELEKGLLVHVAILRGRIQTYFSSCFVLLFLHVLLSWPARPIKY
jgi:hypothetical protein